MSTGTVKQYSWAVAVWWYIFKRSWVVCP